ncbi:hypothetical protein Tco_0627266 [Tanacetum coccineum]|uniref:Uncharacterized protein n=1 Tax=Tanacetum coccineum TaxID=301880 RepID=A0ABQ4WLZ0_9ASTR
MMNINQDYPTSSRTHPYFNFNGGGDGGLKGGLDQRFFKPLSSKTPFLRQKCGALLKLCGGFRELMHSAFIGTLAVSLGSLNESAAHLQYCAAVLGTRSEIIIVNEIPPDHVDDVPIVEPNQHDDVLVVPEPIIEDEDEDPEEDEFEEKNILKKKKMIWKLTLRKIRMSRRWKSVDCRYSSRRWDSLLSGFMRWDIDSLFGRMVNFSRRLCGRETAHALVKKKGKAKDKFYGKLILDLGNEVRSSVEQGAAMEKLVEKLGNTKDKVKCKKLKRELEEARFTNTFFRMQNEQVERDRVRVHEFYQEMIRRGFVFEERPNEAINVPVKDEEHTLKES